MVINYFFSYFFKNTCRTCRTYRIGAEILRNQLSLTAVSDAGEGGRWGG